MSTEHPLGEERKVVSVLFADLVGFTARSEQADPEDVRAVLRAYHGRARAEIEGFGGTVEKFVGDAVVAVFGAPVAHEDDAERAVKAALRLMDAIDELNDESPGLGLSLRAAVNTGEALVSLGGRPEEGEGIVAGDVVNTAARLQQVAAPDEVVVGEATFRSTQHSIEYQPLEAAELKGKAQPVRMWRARGASARVGAERAYSTPFVGREDELEQLAGAYTRASGGRATELVTIVGEPGAGKSRLVRELRDRLEQSSKPPLWRQGQCLPYGEGITFWALGEIVKAQAGVLESDEPDVVTKKLGECIAQAVQDESDREWLTASLAPLVGVAAQGASSGARGASFTAWRRFFEAVAASQGLVLVFEDIHWADAALLEFVEHLAEWAADVPLLVVATARPELLDRNPGFGTGGGRTANLRLPPLSDEATAELLAGLAGTMLPADTQASVLTRAGGNPLFAEEFVRMLRDEGDTRVATAVPESVQALIAARLDALTPAHKSLALDAAVVGEVFWSGALAALGGTDELAVEQGLHELARRQLVRPARMSSVAGQAEFAFWHILVRDVAYGEIPRLARSQKHSAAAEWIEELAGERVTDHAELLAYHYVQALELARAAGAVDEAHALEEPARRSLALAGDRALRLDVGQAEAYYRRALDLVSAGDPRRPELLARVGDAVQEDARLREAATLYESAIAELDAADVTRAAPVMLRLNFALRRLGETTRSAQVLADAIELLERGPPGFDLADAYVRRTAEVVLAGRSRDGLAWCERALPLAKRHGDAGLLQRVLQLRGLARCDLGDLCGREDLEESLRLCLEHGLGIETAIAYGNLGSVLASTEGPASAMDILRHEVAFASERGLIHDVLWGSISMLELQFQLGTWNELLDAADWILEEDAQRTEGSQIGIFAREAQARVHWFRGNVPQARGLMDIALPAAREIGDVQAFAPVLAMACVVAEQSGEADAVVRLAQELDRITRESPSYRAAVLPFAVRAVAAVARPELGERLIAGATTAAPRNRNSALTGRAVIAECRGELDSAARLYREAAVRWGEFGFVLEQALALLGEGRCLSQLERQGEAGERLAEASVLLERLGARPLLREAEELLAAVG